MSEWARSGQIDHNLGECDVIHFGEKNDKANCFSKGMNAKESEAPPEMPG